MGIAAPFGICLRWPVRTAFDFKESRSEDRAMGTSSASAPRADGDDKWAKPQSQGTKFALGEWVSREGLIEFLNSSGLVSDKGSGEIFVCEQPQEARH